MIHFQVLYFIVIKYSLVFYFHGRFATAQLVVEMRGGWLEIGRERWQKVCCGR